MDDDVFNIKFLGTTISKLGSFNVHKAYNGKATLRCIENLGLPILEKDQKPFFSLVILDYQMPGMNGDQLTEILKTEKFVKLIGEPPIIGLSANNDEETIKKCISSGMDSFEPKPLKIDRLRKILE